MAPRRGVFNSAVPSTRLGQLEVRQYDLDGVQAQLSPDSLERYQDSIRKLVGLL